jgi:Putative peptidoglycan binding domain
VRNRRNAERGLRLRAASVGAALAFRLWSRATRRPVDTFAILAAIAASFTIVINAVFLQSGSHPAPFFANPRPLQVAGTEPLKRMEPASTGRPAAAAAPSQPAAPRRDDPIADLIGPSPRIAAVQQALSDYGYGQIKPSGILDGPTSAAIEKFEREHKLPVTGELSDRLMRELAVLVGHPLQ